MAIQNPTIEIFSGDTKRLTYTVKDSAGVVIDISGGAFRWALSRLKPDETTPVPVGDALFTKSVGSGITITDGPNGELRVDLAPADTEDLTGSHYHELEMILGGSTSTVAYGQMDIRTDLLE